MKTSLQISVYSPAFCFLIFTAFFCCHVNCSDAEKAFDQIYQQGAWGKDQNGRGTSGSGSTLTEGKPFVDYLQALIDRIPSIQSVVDIGCGDWVLARNIHWGERDYVGIDVVESVVSTNQSKFGAERIHFIQLDAINEDLPSGDLVICKDVLQHLPNSCIFALLAKFKKFHYCVIVNDRHLRSRKNKDTYIGGYRPIDLTAAPFFLQPREIFNYVSGSTFKQILLLENVNID